MEQNDRERNAIVVLYLTGLYFIKLNSILYKATVCHCQSLSTFINICRQIKSYPCDDVTLRTPLEMAKKRLRICIIKLYSLVFYCK